MGDTPQTVTTTRAPAVLTNICDMSAIYGDFDIVTERQKNRGQKDNKTKDDEQYSEDIQTTPNDLLRSKQGDGEQRGGCHQDFLIY